MKTLITLLELINAENSKERLIELLGNIKKQIGNIIVLESLIDGVSGIGVVKDNNKILSLSIVLRTPISFQDLKSLFTEHNLSYNHNDEKSILSFQVENKINVYAKKDGFCTPNELSKQLFSEFDFTFS